MIFANTPNPPYYAVIFTSIKSGKDQSSYQKMAKEMNALVAKQEGFLGQESACEDLGITVSYWKDLKAIKKWKENPRHSIAQTLGKEKYYSDYKVRICKVERDY